MFKEPVAQHMLARSTESQSKSYIASGSCFGGIADVAGIPGNSLSAKTTRTSPLAGVCNGQVWNAPSIPQKMLGASSTCPLQTDTKPWSRSGLGVVGEGDWSVGRASRCDIALRLHAFFYHAKPQRRKGAKKGQPNSS